MKNKSIVWLLVTIILSFTASASYIDGFESLRYSADFMINVSDNINIVTNNISRLYIEQDGDIGIGTTSPVRDFDLRGKIIIQAGNPSYEFNETDASTNNKLWKLKTQNERWSLEALDDSFAAGNNIFAIDRNGNELETMFIGQEGSPTLFVNTSSTFVGIGKDNPLYKLDIAGGMRIGDTSDANEGALRYRSNQFQGYNGTEWTALSGGGAGSGLWSLNNTNEAYYTDGNVGIGTSDPATLLHLKAATGSDSILRIDSTDADGTSSSDARIEFYEAGSRRWEIYNDGGNQDKYLIDANGVNVFTIQQDGNVGIGTLTPTEKLFVQGGAEITGGLVVNGTDILGNLSILLSSNGTQATLIDQLRTDIIANSTLQQLLLTSNATQAQFLTTLNSSNYTQANLINQLRTDLIANSTLQQELQNSNSTQANLINQIRTDLIANSSLQQELLNSNMTQALRLLNLESSNTTQANLIAALQSTISTDYLNVSAGAENYVYSTNHFLGNVTYYTTDSARLTVNGSMLLKDALGVQKILLNGTDGTISMQGDLFMNENAINNVSDPTDPQDAATKNYIDTQLASLNSDKINEGDSSVEVYDPGTGYVNITVDGTTVMQITANGVNITGAITGDGSNISGAGFGTFVGKTSGTQTAALADSGATGYTAGNLICAAEYSGSHLCSFAEISFTIATKNVSNIAEWTGYGWIATGGAKYSPAPVPVGDCDGFTHGTPGTHLGSWWNFDHADSGRGEVGHCGNTLALACCKVE